MRIIILGASGMLGSMLAEHLSAAPDLQLTLTVRDRAQTLPAIERGADRVIFDVEHLTQSALDALLEGADWVINAIGLIKPYIRDAQADTVERAIRVNALFPHSLAQAAARQG